MANSDKNIRIVTSRNKATYPNIVFTGSSAGSSVITLNVLDDNTLSFESNEGQIFSLDSNLSSGTIYSVTDISGIPLLRASAGATIGIAEYSGFVGIGTDIPTNKLQVRGQVAFASTNDQSLTFIFDNSAAAGNANFQIRSANELRFYNSGNTFYTGFKAGASTANTTFTLPISDGTSGQILRTNGSAALAFTSFAPISSQSSIVSTGASNLSHLLIFTPAQSTSGSALSTNTTLVYNPSTDILSVSGISVTSSTSSSSTTTGALIVSGGLGLAGNAFIGGTLSVSQPITIQNGGTNASSFGQSSGFVLYDGANNKLVAGSGASVTPAGYWTFDSRVYATSFFANNQQMPNGSAGSGNQGKLTYWSGANTINGAAGATWDNTNSILRILGTTNSTSTSSGTLIIDGGIGVSANAFIGGTVNITNSTNSTSTTSGALSVSGGLGLNGNAFIGGTVNIVNTTAATGVSSAALVVAGGLGVNGDVFICNTANSKLSVMQSSGDEGGEIFLNKPQTNSTITNGVTIDIYQNRLRFFEQGGSTRGFYLDITTGGNSVGTNIMGSSSSGTVNNGTANYAAYYAATGNAVSENANLQFTGSGISIGGNINASSTTSGSLSVRGGVGITGNAVIGGTVLISNNTQATFGSTTDGALVVTGGVGVGGAVYIGGQLGVGGTLDYSVVNNVAYFASNTNSYAQVINHNHSNGDSASSDFIVSNDQSTDTAYYGDFGINSSGWAATTSAYNSANAVYLVSAGGDLALGTLTDNNIRFFHKNGVTDVVSISGFGLSILHGTNSSSTYSGALTVSGGIGITGNAFIGGTVVLSNTTNSTSVNSGALEVDGGIGIGLSASIGGRLQLFNSSLYTAFVSSQSGVSTVYTLPSSTPSATGTSVLSSSQDGTMSWVPLAAGGGSGSVNSGTAGSIAVYSGSTEVSAFPDITINSGAGVSINSNINVRSGNELRISNASNVYTAIKASTSLGSNNTITLPSGNSSTASSYLTVNSSGEMLYRPAVDKRFHRIQFGAALNPVAGAENAIFEIPFSYADGTSSVTYRMKRAHVRVETASATGSSFRIEKYAYDGGTGVSAFSTSSNGSTTNIMASALIIGGSTTYEASTTSFAGTHITAVSGDKLRLFWLAASNTQYNFSISLTMEEDV